LSSNKLKKSSNFRNMRKDLSKSTQEKKREKCSLLLQNKVGKKKIAKQAKISRTTIRRVSNMLKQRRTTRRKKGFRGNNKLSKGEKMKIRNLIRRNPFPIMRRYQRKLESLCLVRMHQTLFTSFRVSKKKTSFKIYS